MRQSLRLLLILLAALVAAPALVPAALAEPEAAQAEKPAAITFDRAALDALFKRASEVIDEGAASTRALEELRAQLVEARTRATAARDRAAQAAKPIEDRLKALGDPPSDGTTEPPEIASLRAELKAQLEQVRAPLLAAEDARKQAEALISRLDALLRERQTRALLERVPSPLLPASWSAALNALGAYSESIGGELRAALANDSRRAARLATLPLATVLLAAALLLLFRSRRWSRAMQDWIADLAGPRWMAAMMFLGAILQLALPALGLVLLVQAVTLLDLFGLRGYFLLRAIALGGFALFFTTWLTRLLFVPSRRLPALVEVSEEERRTLRLSFNLVGLAFALRLIVPAVTGQPIPSETMRAAEPTLLFPLIVVAGIGLARIGRRMVARTSAGLKDPETNNMVVRVAHLIGYACIGAGVIGPIAAAAGYVSLGDRLVFASALSLVTVAGLYILFRLVVGAVAPPEDTGDEKGTGALFRITFAIILVLAAIPLLALIWGMRLSQLQEIWFRLSEGIAIGETRISLTDFLAFVLVFAIGYSITRLVQTALKTSVMPYTRLDVGAQTAIVTGTGYLGIFLSALFAISATGLDLSNLALVAGALSVGIGFGLQNIVSNFVSGIILLIERPIKLGDWIEVGGNSGYVSKISVRSTEIETFDRATVIVPNSDLISGVVTNWTHSSLVGRVRVPVGVSYSSDTQKVEAVLLEVARAHPLVLENPEPRVMFLGFGPDSMDFEIRAFLRDANYMLSAKSDMNHEIVRRFREEGIEIPFPQRDVHIKNVGELRGAFAGAPREEGA